MQQSLLVRGIQTLIVIPAQAGIHCAISKNVDPCLRRDDTECVRKTRFGSRDQVAG